jgi:hypothetical protein
MGWAARLNTNPNKGKPKTREASAAELRDRRRQKQAMKELTQVGSEKVKNGTN